MCVESSLGKFLPLTMIYTVYTHYYRINLFSPSKYNLKWSFI